jgi:PDZ domain
MAMKNCWKSWVASAAIALFLRLAPVIAFSMDNVSRWTVHRYDTSLAALTVPGMWGAGLNFGKGEFVYYKSFESFMKPFSAEDREAFPEIFNIPKGVYEVCMTKPLGIVFEEIEARKGVFVQDLVEGGLAEVQGKVKVGDILVAVTAVKIVGAKYERRLIPARKFDFDTAVGAIGSNQPKWGCNDVMLMFERPGEADPAETDKFLAFFEPPFDNP